jgi:hypothetical protein
VSGQRLKWAQLSALSEAEQGALGTLRSGSPSEVSGGATDATGIASPIGPGGSTPPASQGSGEVRSAAAGVAAAAADVTAIPQLLALATGDLAPVVRLEATLALSRSEAIWRVKPLRIARGHAQTISSTNSCAQGLGRKRARRLRGRDARAARAASRGCREKVVDLRHLVRPESLIAVISDGPTPSRFPQTYHRQHPYRDREAEGALPEVLVSVGRRYIGSNWV